ncbi:MAG TPA: hypothetical protein VG365_02730 [Solirubrobacteraceae bacterium]|jgi:hypothetical protein|nr:hypothetical protein [Solirubrobacteraceae bacterium]
MYYNRDELMLLGRRGSVPPAARAGPPGRLYDYGDGRYRRLPPAEPWLLQLLGAAVRRMLRHGRGGAARPGGRGPAVGYADRESYLELEFAVGFAAEDEPWP